ncbi:MAG: hypothetical protein QXU97_01970 [Fervidicoccaceae archaeon]
MSVGRARGINAMGHLGWVTKKCAVCSIKLDISKRLVYYCDKCSKTLNAFFCEADAKRLRYRCPYCGEKLATYFEIERVESRG